MQKLLSFLALILLLIANSIPAYSLAPQGSVAGSSGPVSSLNCYDTTGTFNYLTLDPSLSFDGQTLRSGLSIQPITTDTDASTVTMNLATSSWHSILTTSGIGSNRTLALSNPTVGEQFTVQIIQAASGGPYTVTWFSGITWNGGTAAPTLQTAANAIDTITFKCTGSGAYIGYPTYQNIFTNITATHQIAGGTAPTVAAGAGAGTSPTISITGHDTDCQVTLTTGTLPTGTNAVVATITYGTAYAGTTPMSYLQAANSNASTLATAVLQPYMTNTLTTAVINSGTTGLTAATTYIWNVHTGQ